MPPTADECRRTGHSAQGFDDPDHLIGTESLTASEVQQLSSPKNDCATFWCARDANAPTSTEFEKSFIPQETESTQNRIRINTKDCGQVFGWRQSFAGTSLSFGNGTPDLASYLLMERQRFGSIDIDT